MICSDFSVQLSPKFRVLSDDQIKEIHYATLEVLERTGVKIDSEKAKELLYSNGAYVDNNGMVKIPGGLIEEAIDSAPSRAVVCNRDGERCMFLEGRKSYYGGSSSSPFVFDPYTRQLRQCESKDVANLAKINDYLPNMDFIMPEGHSVDAEPHLEYRVEVRQLLRNTKLPILLQSPVKIQYFDDIIEMAAIVAGGYDELKKKPNIISYTEPISPLYHSSGLEVAMKAAQYGLPVVYTAMPIGGATAPVTFSGTLVQNNAEYLSGLAVIQLLKKGHPCVYGGIPNPLDMASTFYPYGAPELALLCAAMADIGHYYEMPIFGTAGISEGKTIDAQVGIELTWSLLYAALSGANLIHDIGFYDANNIVSMETHILTDEIIDGIKVLCSGIDVTPEQLAIDVIDKVGSQGSYIAEEHTYKHFRKVWRPKYLDRTPSFEAWELKGKPMIFDTLNAKVKDIIENYNPEPLPQEVISELDKVSAKWKE